MPKINIKLIENIQLPTTKEIRILDNEIKGFGVRIYPSGKRTYFYMYSKYNDQGKRKRITHKLGSNINPHVARKLASELSLKLLSGEEIGRKNTQCKKKNEPQKANEEISFFQLADEYVEKHLLIHNKKKTQTDYLRHIEYLKSKILNIPVSKITKKMFMDFRDDYARTKGKRTANVLLTMSSKIFTLATEWEYIDKSPVNGIKKFKEVPRDRVLSKKELKILFEAIEEEDDIYQSTFFKTLAYTACRKNELGTMKWSDLDYSGNDVIWRKPNTKIGEPQKIVLCGKAVEGIKNLKKKKDNPYVFAGTHGTQFQGYSKTWGRILKRSKLPHTTIHDIRRSVGSLLLEDGVSIERISQLLGHKSIKTTEQVYARLSLRSAKQTANDLDKSLEF